MVDAFSHEFRFAIHLYCFNHVRNNLKRELQVRKFPESAVNDIIEQILGKNIGCTYCEGLVDAESETVFYQKLEDFKGYVENKESENRGCQTGFYDWFCNNKVDTVILGMLRPVREEAGLGIPPPAFTTNASESINAMIKKKVDYKKNEFPAFMNHLKQIIDEQDRELERAVIGRGKYEFVEEYKFLEIKEMNLFKMTREQRKKHIQKVANVQIAFTAETPGDSDTLSSLTKQLGVNPEEFHVGLKIPLSSIKGIWKKAEELLSLPDAITSAPGFGGKSKMVMSRNGKRPHLVTQGKGGRVSCDGDCPNWKSMGICSHSVAVAHLNGSLNEFCNFYRKSKCVPNITQLVTTGIPGGVGKKENRVSRKRKHEPVSSRVPLVVPVGATSSGLSSIAGPSVVSGLTLHPFGSLAPANFAPVAQSMQLSTNQGDINIQSPNQSNSPYSYMNVATPQSYEVFCLCFRTGNISIYNGCRNKFDKSAKPPNDLCVQHEEWRWYTSPVSHLPESRFGNAYYHASPHCIQARWPMFYPGSLHIPYDVVSNLLPEHKMFLYTHFSMFLEL